jgi:hypothetical protein
MGFDHLAELAHLERARHPFKHNRPYLSLSLPRLGFGQKTVPAAVSCRFAVVHEAGPDGESRITGKLQLRQDSRQVIAFNPPGSESAVAKLAILGVAASLHRWILDRPNYVGDLLDCDDQITHAHLGRDEYSVLRSTNREIRKEICVVDDGLAKPPGPEFVERPSCLGWLYTNLVVGDRHDLKVRRSISGWRFDESAHVLPYLSVRRSHRGCGTRTSLLNQFLRLM